MNADEIHQDGRDNDWAIRSNYWLKKINPTPQYKARKRRVIHRPLVLCGHGIRLRVDSGTLLITCGFTHYPQNREEYRFFPGDRQLPSRIVILDGDGSITLNALEWLSGQSVPLVQLDWRGEVSSIGGAAYAANSDLVAQQLDIQRTGKGLEYAKWLVLEKIKHSCDTLRLLAANDPEAKLALKKMKEQAKAVRETPPDTIRELLTLEGIAAAAYFRYWHTLHLCWRGIGRKPIPLEWKRIGPRTCVTSKRNQSATHPVNAILNYAYGVLENQIRGYVLAVGADPSIGYLHTKIRSQASFVFDLMEPVRPIMDRKVLEFVMSRTFTPDDFILNKNGVCRLHPQFARFLVKSIQDLPEIEKMTAFNLNKLFGQKIAC